MAQRIEFRQAMGQQMLLAPRMLQSIELLALPALELESFLREQAEQNEALVVEEPKLERMSLRTMPESSSTLTPFDPSPG